MKRYAISLLFLVLLLLANNSYANFGACAFGDCTSGSGTGTGTGGSSGGQVCKTMEALAAADDGVTFWMPTANSTITNVYCRYDGTGTTPATFTLQDASGNGMTITGTNPTCVTTTTSASKSAVTAANTLVTGEGLQFNVTNAVAPETDRYTLCVDYTTP